MQYPASICPYLTLLLHMVHSTAGWVKKCNPKFLQCILNKKQAVHRHSCSSEKTHAECSLMDARILFFVTRSFVMALIKKQSNKSLSISLCHFSSRMKIARTVMRTKAKLDSRAEGQIYPAVIPGWPRRPFLTIQIHLPHTRCHI